MWIALLKVELLKTKRSLSLLMMVACPFAVVLLQALFMLNKNGGELIEQNGWNMLWTMGNSLWSYFMLPLYVALITTLLNGNEHKHATWRLMLSLPIKPFQLYWVKALLAWLFVIGSTFCLYLWIAALIIVFKVSGTSNSESLTTALDYPFFAQLGKTAIACLPILVIQHALSWRIQNMVAPLALGVIATMGIMKIGQSEHWLFYPWSYTTMATMGGSEANQQLALILSGMTGLVLLLVSTLWLSRSEVLQ